MKLSELGTMNKQLDINIPIVDCSAAQIFRQNSRQRSSVSVTCSHDKTDIHNFSDKIQLKKLALQYSEKKECVQMKRDNMQYVAKQMLMDVLTKEWICKDLDDADVYAYLIDRVLPTLVLGLEKLLTEVSEWLLVDPETTNGSFNPINYLAQFLMRNNPRYCSFNEATSYARGLRGAGEQMKLELPHMTDNR